LTGVKNSNASLGGGKGFRTGKKVRKKGIGRPLIEKKKDKGGFLTGEELRNEKRKSNQGTALKEGNSLLPFPKKKKGVQPFLRFTEKRPFRGAANQGGNPPKISLPNGGSGKFLFKKKQKEVWKGSNLHVKVFQETTRKQTFPKRKKKTGPKKRPATKKKTEGSKVTIIPGKRKGGPFNAATKHEKSTKPGRGGKKTMTNLSKRESLK